MENEFVVFRLTDTENYFIGLDKEDTIKESASILDALRFPDSLPRSGAREFFKRKGRDYQLINVKLTINTCVLIDSRY